MPTEACIKISGTTEIEPRKGNEGGECAFNEVNEACAEIALSVLSLTARADGRRSTRSAEQEGEG